MLRDCRALAAVEMDVLRWSRGCGTGVGLSHHTNEYRWGRGGTLAGGCACGGFRSGSGWGLDWLRVVCVWVRSGVRIGNWLEDRQGAEDGGAGRHVLGFAGEFVGESVQATTIGRVGK